MQIEDNECHILLLVYNLKEIGVKTVTPQMIQNYSTLSNQELNKVLGSLLEKKFIYNHLGAINLNNLTDTYQGVAIEEAAQDWILGVYKQYSVNFTVQPTTILNNSQEVIWGNVADTTSTNFVSV